MSNEEVQRLVKDGVGRLLEHVDSVRVFVTWHDSETGETRSYESGGGNFYAQLGQVVEWLEIQRQYSREEANRMDARGRDEE